MLSPFSEAVSALECGGYGSVTTVRGGGPPLTYWSLFLLGVVSNEIVTPFCLH